MTFSSLFLQTHGSAAMMFYKSSQSLLKHILHHWPANCTRTGSLAHKLHPRRGLSTDSSAPRPRITENSIEVFSHVYPRDDMTNVTDKILSKVGCQLHNRPHHPLWLIKERIKDHSTAPTSDARETRSSPYMTTSARWWRWSRTSTVCSFLQTIPVGIKETITTWTAHTCCGPHLRPSEGAGALRSGLLPAGWRCV